jgi:DNA invertase Pin-like site-specific DNA recombinase
MAVTATEVGGIIRVSTQRQAEESDSPANQRHVLAAQGATRFYEYVGSGFSLEKRRASAAWQNLLQDIKAGGLHRLLATDISRAARKDELLTELIQLCDQHGVEFLAAGLKVTHGTAMSWYSAKQMSLMAELYSRDLSDRIKRGQAAAIARGIPAFTSKQLPWHLMREPGTKHGVIQHPERWDDAREAVLDYIEGRARLDALSARIHAKHGTMSCAAAMHKWLRSHSLLGHYGKRDGPILITNCFPALISPEEGQLLQLRLQANRKRWGTTSTHTVYAMTGLCRCLHCGYAMSYTSARKPNGTTHRYLKCASKRDCPGFRKLVSADLIEMAVHDLLGHALEEMALKGATRSDQVAESAEVVQMRQRVRKLEILVAELDSPGIREDLKQAKTRLKTLEAASSKPDSKRLDQAKAMLLRAGNRFMDRPEGERNADLLTVMDHCLIDTTYQPEGQDWERRIVQQIVLR